MKKMINGFVLIIIVALVGYTIMDGDIFSKDFDASCNQSYDIVLNEMSVICDIQDPNNIITDEHPMTIILIDSSDVIIDEQSLFDGENPIDFDILDYNAEYTIIASGYELIDDDYAAKEYYNFSFSTVYENFIIPTVDTSNLVTTDNDLLFDINLTDTQNTLVSISITATSNDVLSEEVILTNFDDLSIPLDSLEQLTTYTIVVTGTYAINDYDVLTSELNQFEVTTLKTPELPTASLTIIKNDNIDLEVSISVSNNDATSVSYAIALLDNNDNIILSKPWVTQVVSFDISSITSDYRIAVLSSYNLSSTYHTNIEITSYMITTNIYSNFFAIPGLEVVDTTLPLSSYEDYDDYVYSHFNDGHNEFRIECSENVDCASLVNDEPYASIPFKLIGMVHSYYVTKNIYYSFTSSYVDITVDYVYTPAQMIAVENEVDSILNTIISDGMTELEKIEAVHDFVVNESVYDTQCYENPTTCNNDHSAYGVLFDKNAVCEGYSHAVDILLRALRIPSIRISSVTHQWNGIYFNNEWVHLDATWDDPVTMDGSNVLIHDYFLINTATLETNDSSGTHTFDMTYMNFIE